MVYFRVIKMVIITIESANFTTKTIAMTVGSRLRFVMA